MLSFSCEKPSQLQAKLCANQQTMFAPEDIPLLKYYQQPVLAQADNISLLQPEYFVERMAESYVRKNYLSKEDREYFAVTCENGTWQDADGCNLMDAYLYCLLPDNRLYAASISYNEPLDKQLVRNHSHLVAGLPVKAAGILYFKDGKLITISNDSGHYKPTVQNMMPSLAWFTDQACAPVLFEDHSNAEKSKQNCGIRHCDARTLLLNPSQPNWLLIPALEQYLATHHAIRLREPSPVVLKALDYSTDALSEVQSTVDNIPFTGLQGNITASRFKSRKKGWSAAAL